jgi:CheY-like chemotaxis protein
MTNPRKPIEILLVEDSPTDADLTIRGLSQGKLYNNVHCVEDGVEAMAFLRREGEYSNVPRPDLILLDLNMPRIDGRGVLQAVRGDGSLKLIPIIVLTTSNEEQDVVSAYGLASNAYIVKPVDVDRFFDVVRQIAEFWFQIVRLPHAE